MYDHFTGENWLFNFYIFLAIKIWCVFLRINYLYVFLKTFYFAYFLYLQHFHHKSCPRHIFMGCSRYVWSVWLSPSILFTITIRNWIELFLLLNGYCILWSWCSITLIDKLPLGRHMFWWHNQPSTLWIVLWYTHTWSCTCLIHEKLLCTCIQ